MRKFPLMAAMVLGLATHALAGDPAINMVMPFDGAIISSESALILYETPPGINPIVYGNDIKMSPSKVVGGNKADLHHQRTKLREGKNYFRFVDPATEKELGNMTVYFVPSSSLKRVKTDKSKKFVFHVKENENKCNECHPMPEEMETVAGKPMSPAGKACSSCHPTVGTAERPHKPTEVYECFSCHETKYKPARFGLQSSQMALCATCHPKTAATMLAQKFVHGPVGMGSCIICHDSHGGQSKGLIREKTNEMCLKCHSDTVPLGVEKALHKDQGCIECHEPHGADNPDLAIKSGAQLCLNCHEDPSIKYNGHPIPGHPSQAPVDPSKPGRAMGCPSCHNVHGKPDVSQMKILDDTELQRTFCFKCHYS